MDTATAYLTSVEKQFRQYYALGKKALLQVTDEELNRIPATGSNSMTIIVQHMHGNLKSRFTNFLTEDGEKPWRQRDAEFDIAQFTQKQALHLWEEGWNCLFTALTQLNASNLTQTVTIRHEPHTAIDAINRQLAHHASHVGQLILLAKMYRQKDWQSLSIRPGQSKDFNEDMKSTYSS